MSSVSLFLASSFSPVYGDAHRVEPLTAWLLVPRSVQEDVNRRRSLAAISSPFFLLHHSTPLPSPPMAAAGGLCLPLSFLLLISLVLSLCSSSPPPRTTYIVHVAGSHKPDAFATHFEWYASAVASVTSSLDEPAGNRIVYSYDTAFHGFAARLGDAEAELLGQVPGVLAVLPETVYDLHTTRSPEFLGIGPEVISNGVWSSALA